MGKVLVWGVDSGGHKFGHRILNQLFIHSLRRSQNKKTASCPHYTQVDSKRFVVT